MSSVEKVLSDLDLKDKPRLLVFNKCDEIHPMDAIRFGEEDNSVAISALKKEGFRELLKKAALYLWPSSEADTTKSAAPWSPNLE